MLTCCKVLQCDLDRDSSTFLVGGGGGVVRGNGGIIVLMVKQPGTMK